MLEFLEFYIEHRFFRCFFIDAQDFCLTGCYAGTPSIFYTQQPMDIRSKLIQVAFFFACLIFHVFFFFKSSSISLGYFSVSKKDTSFFSVWLLTKQFRIVSWNTKQVYVIFKTLLFFICFLFMLCCGLSFDYLCLSHSMSVSLYIYPIL